MPYALNTPYRQKIGFFLSVAPIFVCQVWLCFEGQVNNWISAWWHALGVMAFNNNNNKQATILNLLNIEGQCFTRLYCSLSVSSAHMSESPFTTPSSSNPYVFFLGLSLWDGWICAIICIWVRTPCLMYHTQETVSPVSLKMQISAISRIVLWRD